MDYYDLVLGTIPASLLGGTGILGALGIDLLIALPLGGVIALAIILHALFIRGPAQQRPTPTPSSTGSTAPSSQPAD